MLVLTHKEGEVLQIGDDIRIQGNWVRLCIDAPRNVELRRLGVDEVDGMVETDRD